MKRRFLAFIGLTKPYRFERTLAFLATAVLALVVWGIGLRFYMSGSLRADTPRELYFIYLSCLLLAAFLLIPLPRLAAVFISVAAIEVGLGFGSLVLQRLGVVVMLVLPNDAHVLHNFRWHPVLQAVAEPSAQRIWPRQAPHHNAMGLRGPERQPGALREKVVVEAFGGSTTYDIEVADGETWPEMLEKALGADRYAVLNHGVPAYSTVENVIQTAFYEAPYGEAPRCALYYVGWNDLRSIHLPGLDPGYADNHLPGQVDALQVRRLDGPMYLASPLLTLIGRLVVLGFDTARPAPKLEGGNRTDPDPALEAIFARNVHTISAINRQRGIRTIWVGQIANRELLATGTSGRRMTFVAETDLWTVLQWFLGILKREAAAAGDVYVELPNDRFTNADFVDTDHFRAAGSRKFAELLAPTVAEACGGAAPGGR